MLARCYLGFLAATDSDDLEDAEEEDGTEDDDMHSSSGREIKSERETHTNGD